VSRIGAGVMPYLNLDPDYFAHPKTVRLCGLLGPEAGVYPLKLWAYCAKFHPINADLSTYSKEEIESAIGWRGEAGKLVDSLVRVGMLEVCDEHFCVHDWKEHQGHLEAYKVRGKIAAEARWAKLRAKKEKNATSNASSMLEAMPQPTNQPAIPTNQLDKKHIWFSDSDFSLAWNAWEKERKKKGTVRGFEKLKTISGGDIKTAIAVLNQSADNQWQGLFELKESKKPLIQQRKTVKVIA